MRVEMLAVGKELLIGRTLNSNAHWVGKRLAQMGSMLKEVTTIDDDLGEIEGAFRAAARRSPDFLVVVGGLGPTPDDMTLKGIAGALGVRLSRDTEALELVKEHYAKRGLGHVELTRARVKMATLPAGAKAVKNNVGTAPGVRVRAGKTVVYCLPGVPAEMRSIYREAVEPEIRGRLGKVHRRYVTLKLKGVLESALAPVLERELRKHPSAYIKSHPRGTRAGVSRIELDISVTDRSRSKAVAEVGEIADDMRAKVAALGGSVESVRSSLR